MSTSVPGVNTEAFSEDFEFAALQEAKNYKRSLLEEFAPYLHGNILEVGAGIGQMTHELTTLPEVKAIDALEPDSRFYAKLVQLEPSVRCMCGTVGDLPPASLYDAVVCVNVLEHIKDDLGELQRMKLHLRPGGRLCLFVPAFQAIYAPIDQSFGHYKRYSKSELRSLFEKAGFRIIHLHYYNFLGFFAWWVNFRLLKKTVFEPGKVRFYDRYLFPVVHALEKNIKRPPFGQSLLAIVEE